MWTYFFIRNIQIFNFMISLSRHNHIKIKQSHETFYIFYLLFTNIHLLHVGEGIMKIYSPKSIIFPPGIWYSWVNKFSYFLYPHAINVLLYRMKQRKHIYVKYCWQTWSIGTLSQIFKNHIVTVACKWCVQNASDAFLSRNGNSGR
jgi:uncharacterized protein YbcV (DUF1398 family)